MFVSGHFCSTFRNRLRVNVRYSQDDCISSSRLHEPYSADTWLQTGWTLWLNYKHVNNNTRGLHNPCGTHSDSVILGLHDSTKIAKLFMRQKNWCVSGNRV